MSKNARHLITAAVLVIPGAAITYFLLTSIYQLPVAASAEAKPIDDLFNLHFLLISLLFALIVVFMLYSFVVFRRKPGDDEEGSHFHGNTPLEIIWTVIPLAVVIAIGVWAAIILSDITEAKANEMQVNVTGRQWSWLFSYPEYEEIGFSNQLVLPVDRTIVLQMTTDDVLHSFWVPEFRVKQDLVPGTITTLRITPTEIGDYKVRCAEICGFDHANMRADVVVISETDFAQWISDQTVSLANLSQAERGEKWASDFGCTGCHTTDGTVLSGPSWLGIFGQEEQMEDGQTITVDEDYLRKSILDPDIQIVEGFPPNLMSAVGDFELRFLEAEAEIAANEAIDIDILEDLIVYIQSMEP
jgi:cytochrome c oxidase subunit 2